MRARRWATFVLGVLLLAAPAYAYLPANIEGVVKSWMNAAGQLVKLRFASSTQSTTPSGYCDVWVDNSTLNLVSRCGSNTPTVIASLSSLGCTQDGSGNLTCNSFSSLDQNSLSPIAANRWRLYDNDVNLTPDPSCTSYGQAGIISILDTVEGSGDTYSLCDGTSFAGNLNSTNLWAPIFPYTGASSNASRPADDDDGACWGFTLSTTVNLDHVTVEVTTQDTDDTVRAAIYSQDGLTEYWESAIDVVSAVGNRNMTNLLSACSVVPSVPNPAGGPCAQPLPAGSYWFCVGYNQVNTQDWQLRGAFNGVTVWGPRFPLDEGVPGGDFPNTITPSINWDTTASVRPVVTLSDQ